MNKNLVLGLAVLFTVSHVSATAFADVDQTEKEKQYNTQKLKQVLKGKTLVCHKRGSKKKKTLVKVWVKNEETKISGPLTGYQDLEEISDLYVGSMLSIQAAGADADEGTAVLIAPTYYIQEDGNTDAEAIIYSMTGPGDGSGKLVKLFCELQ